MAAYPFVLSERLASNSPPAALSHRWRYPPMIFDALQMSESRCQRQWPALMFPAMLSMSLC
ncbi:hypothetical protein BST65_06530 [Bradyrhizobium canariense]|nr:hypothetical protein BST65_06530 [Bradyrhizobium canariense]OSI37316.1 hypothetical protein BST66_03715 [Bradyrhizobium canariense]OSI52036.1 hypothetical protein BSZ20_04190 [Bradyrhizobium canariense]OSI56339.1 hypothetical protein BST67_03680 [Bradyrhizobium canariense]OSI59411.1 hypothetical protein BSZ15_04910 [Bradyrhizobium canariense]